MTITEKAKKYFQEGKIKEALKIYKTFRYGFSEEEKGQISRAAEMLNGFESFYKQLGYDKDIEVKKAVYIIAEKIYREKKV